MSRGRFNVSMALAKAFEGSAVRTLAALPHQEKLQDEACSKADQPAATNDPPSSLTTKIQGILVKITKVEHVPHTFSSIALGLA